MRCRNRLASLGPSNRIGGAYDPKVDPTIEENNSKIGKVELLATVL